MLRTGNLLKIRKMDFSFIKQSSRDIVVLPETKSVHLQHGRTSLQHGRTTTHFFFAARPVGLHHGARKVGIRQGSTAPHRQCGQRTRYFKSAKSHHAWRLSSMATLHLGRLRRPSSGREARSRGHSPRASGAGGEACVHRDCNLQVWIYRSNQDFLCECGSYDHK